jgi:hypothetical protein
MLDERWRETAAARAREVALREAATGRTWTFAELRAAADAEILPPGERRVARRTRRRGSSSPCSVLAGRPVTVRSNPVRPRRAAATARRHRASQANLGHDGRGEVRHLHRRPARRRSGLAVRYARMPACGRVLARSSALIPLARSDRLLEPSRRRCCSTASRSCWGLLLPRCPRWWWRLPGPSGYGCFYAGSGACDVARVA